MGSVATERSKVLHIGDGRDWHFVNGEWQDGADGILEMPEGHHDLEILHYAFHRQLTCQEVRVRFEFLLTAHSDVGIILQARNESDFSLLHFPNCAQAFRAQHFWAALSRMEPSGYLKNVKLDLVRRVPSNPEIWIAADLSVVGSQVSVRIGDHGVFEASDEALREPGRLGLFLSGGAQIRNVRVDGTPLSAPEWDEKVRQPVNWFQPYPGTEYGTSQKATDLLRLPDGELILNFSVREQTYSGPLQPMLIRSRDNGHTWSDPEPLRIVQEEGNWGPANLHLTPGNRLISIFRSPDSTATAESPDGGRTWSPPEALDLGPKPEKMKNLGPQAPVNLADGTMLMFMLGAYDMGDPELSIYVWGGHHYSAYCTRSTDDGRTWSPPVHMDNSAGLGTAGMTGNLDLTEVCGIDTADGRVMALIRPVYSPWMWETWSTDGGQTWGPCVRGPFPGYATPKMFRTSSGKLLVPHRLASMTIHCSPDDGHTWDQGTQVDAALWVMGAMTEVEPDLVLYVYRTETLMRAQFIRVTDHGLEPVPR